VKYGVSNDEFRTAEVWILTSKFIIRYSTFGGSKSCKTIHWAINHKASGSAGVIFAFAAAPNKTLFARRLGRPAYGFVLFPILKICLDPIYLAVSHLEHMEIGPDVVKKCVRNHDACIHIH